MKNKYIEKALVSLGGAGAMFLVWRITGSWFPFMDSLPVAFGLTGTGVALGVFCSDEIIENLKIAKEKVMGALKVTDENDEDYDDYDDDEDELDYDDEYTVEETIYDISQEDSDYCEKSIDEYDFYLQDQYYKDIVKWYREQGCFDEARETYCTSRNKPYEPLKGLRVDIDALQDALLTIVDVCGDRLYEESKDDADLANIINDLAYKVVYNACYYTIVNGQDVVDEENVIKSIVGWPTGLSFDEKSDTINCLCAKTGVINPITKKPAILNEDNDKGAVVIKVNFKK